MHRNPERPLSPHLTIWKWGPHMLVSILHRITGTGLAIVGGAVFVWWLLATADGPDAYAAFTGWAVDWALALRHMPADSSAPAPMPRRMERRDNGSLRAGSLSRV